MVMMMMIMAEILLVGCEERLPSCKRILLQQSCERLGGLSSHLAIQKLVGETGAGCGVLVIRTVTSSR